MYGDWQAQINLLQQEHSDALETAINSESKTNTLLVCEKKERLEVDAKYNRLVSEHEALRAQLAGQHEAQKKKMIMEYESKLLAMKNQHAEGLQLQERRAEESLDQVDRELEKSKHKQDLLAEAQQKDIKDMKSRYPAKLRQSEHERRAYKTEVTAAVTGWHKKVNRLEAGEAAGRSTPGAGAGQGPGNMKVAHATVLKEEAYANTHTHTHTQPHTQTDCQDLGPQQLKPSRPKDSTLCQPPSAL